MAHEQGTRIWPLAIAFTVVFLIGGALGYVVGRPSEAPAPRGTLLAGQVRIPNVLGLSVSVARRILAPMGLEAARSRNLASREEPAGIVLAQGLQVGRVVRPPRTVALTVSAGPGAGPGPTYVFSRSDVIRIDHLGPYRWDTPRVAFDGPPVSLGANTRVIGNATVTPYGIARERGPTGTAIVVSFRVISFHGPAWYVIVRAFSRQRESSSVGPTVGVRRLRGRALEIAGNSCHSRRFGSAPLLAQHAGEPDSADLVVPLVSLYAFRVRLPIDDIPSLGPPGRPVVFRVEGTDCRSRPLRIG